MMIVPIPTDEADPQRRLQRTHELLRRAKERHKATAGEPAHRRHAASSRPRSPRCAARTTMEVLGRTRPPLNLVISNVPGPRDAAVPRRRASSRRTIPVSVVIDGVGLNITCMSYLDHVDFGIVADRDQVDDVWTLMDRLAHALDELTVAVLGKAAKRRAKRAAPPRAPAKAES